VSYKTFVYLESAFPALYSLKFSLELANLSRSSGSFMLKIA